MKILILFMFIGFFIAFMYSLNKWLVLENGFLSRIFLIVVVVGLVISALLIGKYSLLSDFFELFETKSRILDVFAVVALLLTVASIYLVASSVSWGQELKEKKSILTEFVLTSIFTILSASAFFLGAYVASKSEGGSSGVFFWLFR